MEDTIHCPGPRTIACLAPAHCPLGDSHTPEFWRRLGETFLARSMAGREKGRKILDMRHVVEHLYLYSSGEGPKFNPQCCPKVRFIDLPDM